MVTADDDDDSDNDCLFIDENPTEPDNVVPTIENTNTHNVPANTRNELPSNSAEVPIDYSPLANNNEVTEIPREIPNISNDQTVKAQQNLRITCKDFSKKPFNSPEFLGKSALHYYLTTDNPMPPKQGTHTRNEGNQNPYNLELKDLLVAPSRPPTKPYAPSLSMPVINGRSSIQSNFKDPRTPPLTDVQNGNQIPDIQSNQISVIVPHPGSPTGGTLTLETSGQQTSNIPTILINGHPTQNGQINQFNFNNSNPILNIEGIPSYRTCGLSCPCRKSPIPASPISSERKGVGRGPTKKPPVKSQSQPKRPRGRPRKTVANSLSTSRKGSMENSFNMYQLNPALNPILKANTGAPRDIHPSQLINPECGGVTVGSLDMPSLSPQPMDTLNNGSTEDPMDTTFIPNLIINAGGPMDVPSVKPNLNGKAAEPMNIPPQYNHLDIHQPMNPVLNPNLNDRATYSDRHSLNGLQELMNPSFSSQYHYQLVNTLNFEHFNRNSMRQHQSINPSMNLQNQAVNSLRMSNDERGFELNGRNGGLMNMPHFNQHQTIYPSNPQPVHNTKVLPCYPCASATSMSCGKCLTPSLPNPQTAAQMTNSQSIPQNYVRQAYNEKGPLQNCVYTHDQMKKAAYLASLRSQADKQNFTIPYINAARQITANLKAARIQSFGTKHTVAMNQGVKTVTKTTENISATKKNQNIFDRLSADMLSPFTMNTEIPHINLTIDLAQNSNTIVIPNPLNTEPQKQTVNMSMDSIQSKVITTTHDINRINLTPDSLEGDLSRQMPKNVSNNKGLPHLMDASRQHEMLTEDINNIQAIKDQPWINTKSDGDISMKNNIEMIPHSVIRATETIPQISENEDFINQVRNDVYVETAVSKLYMNTYENDKRLAHLMETSKQPEKPTEDICKAQTITARPLINTKSNGDQIPLIMDEEDINMKNNVEMIQPSVIKATEIIPQNGQSENFVNQIKNDVDIETAGPQLYTNTDENVTKEPQIFKSPVESTQAYEIEPTTSVAPKTMVQHIKNNNISGPGSFNTEANSTVTVSTNRIIENTVTVSIVNKIVTNPDISLPGTDILIDILNKVNQNSTKSCPITGFTENSNKTFNNNFCTKENKPQETLLHILSKVKQVPTITTDTDQTEFSRKENFNDKEKTEDMALSIIKNTPRNESSLSDDERLIIARQKLARLSNKTELRNKSDTDNKYKFEISTCPNNDSIAQDKIPPLQRSCEESDGFRMDAEQSEQLSDYSTSTCNTVQCTNIVNKEINVLLQGEIGDEIAQEIRGLDEPQENANNESNLSDASIEEMIFFKFQIYFFRLVEERLREYKYEDFATKLHNDILDLIDLSIDKAAKANMMYECHSCHNVSLYSARQLYYYYYRSANVQDVKQNCDLCTKLKIKYIEILLKYVPLATSKGVDSCQTTENTNNNNQRNDLATGLNNERHTSQAAHNDKEEEGSPKKKKNENPSLITKNVPSSSKPTQGAREKQNKRNTPDRQNTANIFVVKLPLNRLKSSTVEALIKNKCNDNNSDVCLKVSEKETTNASVTPVTNVPAVDGNINVNLTETNKNGDKHLNSNSNKTENSCTTSPDSQNKNAKKISTYLQDSNRNQETQSNKKKSCQDCHSKSNKSNCDETAVNANTLSENKDKSDKKQEKISKKRKSFSAETGSTANPDPNNMSLSKTSNNINDHSKDQKKPPKRSKSISAGTETVTNPDAQKQNSNTASDINDSNPINSERPYKIPKRISAETASTASSDANNKNLNITSKNMNHHNKNQEKQSKRRKSTSAGIKTSQYEEGQNSQSFQNSERYSKIRKSISAETESTANPDPNNKNLSTTSKTNNTVNDHDNNQEKHSKRRKSTSGGETIPGAQKQNSNTASDINDLNDNNPERHSKKRKIVGAETVFNKNSEPLNIKAEIHSKKGKSVSAETANNVDSHVRDVDFEHKRDLRTKKIKCDEMTPKENKENCDRDPPSNNDTLQHCVWQPKASKRNETVTSNNVDLLKTTTICKNNKKLQRQSEKHNEKDNSDSKEKSIKAKTTAKIQDSETNAVRIKSRKSISANIISQSQITSKSNATSTARTKTSAEINDLGNNNINGKHSNIADTRKDDAKAKNTAKNLNKAKVKGGDASKNNTNKKSKQCAKAVTVKMLEDWIKTFKASGGSNENELLPNLIKHLGNPLALKTSDDLTKVKTTGKKEIISYIYVCSHCSVRFRSSTKCKNHVVDAHKIAKLTQEDIIEMRKCDYCPNSYVKSESYNAHVITKHADVSKN